MDGRVLVGFDRHLYAVYSNYQFARFEDGIAAIGLGAQVAIGALYVTDGLHPKARLLRALIAAERWNSTVRRPFVIESTEHGHQGHGAL